MELFNRIKETRVKSGLSQKVIANKLDVAIGTYQYYERGERVPPASFIIKLITMFGINSDWLLFGKEPQETRPMIAEKGVIYNYNKDYKDYIDIPMVRGEISAGGGLVPDTTIELKLAFKKDWIQRHGDPRNMSIIRVSGDSMEPTLQSGDLVLVDHNRNCIDPQGGIYAISMNDIIMIKRIQVVYTSQRLRIICDNSRYDPIEAKIDQVNINGKVIWYGREIER